MLMDVRCPECGKSCTFDVTRGRDGLKIILSSQTCLCDVYANFDDVWEQAYAIIREED